MEPEILRDGEHTLSRCEEVTTQVLRTVFQALGDYRVEFEAVILKPNMVTPGTRCIDRISTEQIAEATLRCLHGSVPSRVPGIVFLAGGQTEIEATERLNAINLRGPAPWELSFSFGRALQESALRIWKGLAANVAEAQAAFADRARLNAFARNGLYDREIEKNQQSLVCS